MESNNTRLIIVGVVGVVLGISLLVSLPESWLLGALGLFVFAFGVRSVFGLHSERPISPTVICPPGMEASSAASSAALTAGASASARAFSSLASSANASIDDSLANVLAVEASARYEPCLTGASQSTNLVCV